MFLWGIYVRISDDLRQNVFPIHACMQTCMHMHAHSHAWAEKQSHYLGPDVNNDESRHVKPKGYMLNCCNCLQNWHDGIFQHYVADHNVMILSDWLMDTANDKVELLSFLFIAYRTYGLLFHWIDISLWYRFMQSKRLGIHWHFSNHILYLR